MLEALVEHMSDSRAVTIRSTTTVVGPKPSTTVFPPARQAWDEKRWRRLQQDGQVELVGAYRVYDRQRQRWREFDGRIVEFRGRVATYIADPPVELKQHRHGPCLQLVNAPWFRLHWSREPKTQDDALLYMEGMLDEAINGRT